MVSGLDNLALPGYIGNNENITADEYKDIDALKSKNFESIEGFMFLCRIRIVAKA